MEPLGYTITITIIYAPVSKLKNTKKQQTRGKMFFFRKKYDFKNIVCFTISQWTTEDSNIQDIYSI